MPPLSAPHAQLVPFPTIRDAQGRWPAWATASAPLPRAPGLLPFDDPLPAADERPLSEQDEARVIDAAQEAVCAAMANERGLCALRLERLNELCRRRPVAAQAALHEMQRILQLEIVARHMSTCHKRRQLLRDLQAMLATLRDIER